jgi:hypothetical protein
LDTLNVAAAAVFAAVVIVPLFTWKRPVVPDGTQERPAVQAPAADSCWVHDCTPATQYAVFFIPPAEGERAFRLEALRQDERDRGTGADIRSIP